MVFVDKKNFKLVLFFFLLVSCTSQEKTEKKTSFKKDTPFSIGTNISSISDWSTDYTFVNAFKQARPWVSLGKDKWGDGKIIFSDENGYVKFLQAGQRVATLIFTDTPNSSYQSGTYTLRYKGKGKFKFYGGGYAGIISEKPGEIKLKLESSLGGLIMEIIEIDRTDYIKEIEFIYPGGVCDNNPTEYCDEKTSCNQNAKCLSFEKHHEEIIFHPYFVKDISIYSTLRFMDWMRTNDSINRSWEKRSKYSDYTWATEKGVPIEVIVKLSNLTSKDLWLCMPHQANDDYIQKLAKFVKNNLNPKLNIYIEYSNEVWNRQFKQYAFANQNGQGLGDEKNATYLYYSSRSERMFDIWNEVFDYSYRIKKVIASHFVNTFATDKILKNVTGADYLAVAPYIVTNKFGVLSLEKIEELLIENNALAKEHGLELIAYEAGQHYVPGNDKIKIDQAIKLNRSLEMEDLYKNYLNLWKKNDGKLLMHYYSVGACDQYGCWGAKESHNQAEEFSPKYRALKSFATMK